MKIDIYASRTAGKYLLYKELDLKILVVGKYGHKCQLVHSLGFVYHCAPFVVIFFKIISKNCTYTRFRVGLECCIYKIHAKVVSLFQYTVSLYSHTLLTITMAMHRLPVAKKQMDRPNSQFMTSSFSSCILNFCPPICTIIDTFK